MPKPKIDEHELERRVQEQYIAIIKEHRAGHLSALGHLLAADEDGLLELDCKHGHLGCSAEECGLCLDEELSRIEAAIRLEMEAGR